MKGFAKRLVIYATSLSLAVVFIGGLFLYVNSSEDMGMTPCQAMEGSSAMCPMNLVQHMQMWEQATTTLPGQKTFLPLLAFSLLFISFTVAILEKTFVAKFGSSIDPPEYNFYIKLKTLFSVGILHPKLYA